jgi:hypothetical protein
VHDRLQDYYRNHLDDKGRELFTTVRDHYAVRRDEVQRGLEARINESGASTQTKQQLISELRKKFESGRVSVYFPLSRWGQHWARAMDKDGKTLSYSRFETGREQRAWLTEARRLGLETDQGKNFDSPESKGSISPDFVKKVMGLAHEADPSGRLEQDLWTEYLKELPDGVRKHMIQRQGRLGYSMNALRAFSESALANAHQIARLEHGNKLADLVSQIKQEEREVSRSPNTTQDDKTYAAELTEQMKKRLDWINNPKFGPVSSALTKLGFNWYLGFAPATALRIGTQNITLASPILAKYHGQFGATRELTRATAQWIKSRGMNGLIDSLRGGEREAMEAAKDQGVFMNTCAQSLASGGEGKPLGSGFMDTYARASSYLFNSIEHKNRTTTMLAAYRLGIKQEMTHAEAQQHAIDRTWDAHLDYQTGNRPPVLQSDTAKVLGLFKQYSLRVSSRVAS